MASSTHLDMKAARHAAIRRLLEIGGYTSQEAIVTQMIKEGYDVTQSSISRDFKELGVTKLAGVYRIIHIGTFQSPIKLLVKDIDTAGDNLLVVKTSSGGASAVAEAIDIEGIPGVVGTVAGDNTIFVATKDKSSQSRVIKKINEL
jgi:transcriptional regulator of arginine metabolism